MTFSAIVVAAGSGSRAGGDKQYRMLAGKPVVRWSVEALRGAGAGEIVVVVAPGAEARMAQALHGLAGWRAVAGGVERADSVRAGLASLACAPDAAVLIHDAARSIPPATALHPARPCSACAMRASSPGATTTTISPAPAP